MALLFRWDAGEVEGVSTSPVPLQTSDHLLHTYYLLGTFTYGLSHSGLHTWPPRKEMVTLKFIGEELKVLQIYQCGISVSDVEALVFSTTPPLGLGRQGEGGGIWLSQLMPHAISFRG